MSGPDRGQQYADPFFESPLFREQPRSSWSATELLDTEWPEPKWAVPGVICEGVTLLVGPPKVGKSWLSLNLAVAIAGGTPALEQVPVDRGDVLYLALEDTGRRLASRLTKVLDGRTAPNGLQFETVWPALNDGGGNRLRDWLSQHPETRLVIVDVLARVRGRSAGANENAYDVDYAAISKLKAISDEHSVAVVVVHHTRKAVGEDFLQDVSGTNGLAGAADGVIVLRRTRGTADAELHVTGRDVDEAQYAMTFRPEVGQWQMLDGPAQDYQLADTRREIVQFLRQNPGSTPKQIADGTGLPHPTVKVTVHRMSGADQVISIGNGRYDPPLTPVTSVTPVTREAVTGVGGYSSNRSNTPTEGVGSTDALSTTDSRCPICDAETQLSRNGHPSLCRPCSLAEARAAS